MIAKSFFPLSVITAPAIETSIFFPFLSERRPAGAGTRNLVFEKVLEFFSRIYRLSRFAGRSMSQISGLISAVFIKSLTPSRRRKVVISRIGYELGKGDIERMKWIDILLEKQCLIENM